MLSREPEPQRSPVTLQCLHLKPKARSHLLPQPSDPTLSRPPSTAALTYEKTESTVAQEAGPGQGTSGASQGFSGTLMPVGMPPSSGERGVYFCCCSLFLSLYTILTQNTAGEQGPDGKWGAGCPVPSNKHPVPPGPPREMSLLC